MTDVPMPRRGPARLKLRLSRLERGSDEPGRRVSWEVFARRWLMISISIGYVNARSRSEALARACERWPQERGIDVYLAEGL